MIYAMDGKTTRGRNRFLMVLMVASLLSPAFATTAEPVLPAGPSMQLAGLGAVLLKLALVLGLIVLTGWLLRKFQRRQHGTSKTLEVIDILPVGPKDRILLVRVGETQLLVGSTPGRLTPLMEVAEPVSFATHARQQLQEHAA